MEEPRKDFSGNDRDCGRVDSAQNVDKHKPIAGKKPSDVSDQFLAVFGDRNGASAD